MTLTDLYANNASTTLSGNGGSITAAATSLIVAGTTQYGVGWGLFPVPVNYQQVRIFIDQEIMLVTAMNTSTNTWTVQRGAEGTLAATHNDGATLYADWTAGHARGTGTKANWVFAPNGWDDIWQSAKAAAGSTPVRIHFFGDSIIEGYSSTEDDIVNHSVLGRLATILAGAPFNLSKNADYFPAYGASVDAVGASKNSPWSAMYAPSDTVQASPTPTTTSCGVSNGAQFQVNSPITVNGLATTITGIATNTLTYSAIATAPTAGQAVVGNAGLSVGQQNQGWHKSSYYTATGNFAVQTFTTPYACTAFDIHYLDQNSGTWDYWIDGGTHVTVTNTGGSIMKKVSVTGLSNATHTVSFGNQNSSSRMQIMGVTTFVPGVTGGFQLARNAAQGDGLTYYTSQTGGPSKKPRLYSGVSPQADATQISATNCTYGFPLQPHLFMVMMGLNDIGRGAGVTNVEDFHGTLELFVRAVRAGVPNCSILIAVSFAPDTMTSDATNATNFEPTASGGLSWAQYAARMYEIARMYNCAVVNIHEKWGQFPVNNGFIVSDGVHPTLNGSIDIAQAIASVL